jgi:hypothetical protein
VKIVGRPRGELRGGDQRRAIRPRHAHDDDARAIDDAEPDEADALGGQRSGELADHRGRGPARMHVRIVPRECARGDRGAGQRGDHGKDRGRVDDVLIVLAVWIVDERGGAPTRDQRGDQRLPVARLPGGRADELRDSGEPGRIGRRLRAHCAAPTPTARSEITARSYMTIPR